MSKSEQDNKITPHDPEEDVAQFDKNGKEYPDHVDGKYVDPSDSNSSGNEDGVLPVVAARRTYRKRRRQYKKFIAQNKKCWMCFNVILVMSSILSCIGTGMVVTNDEEGKMMTFCLWLTMLLHVVNFCAGLLNLTGKERKCCFANLLIAFGILEIGLLVFMQVAFFYAQSTEMLSSAPTMYFWLYGQILALYTGLGLVLCYVFRGFCQDQFLEDDSWRR